MDKQPRRRKNRAAIALATLALVISLPHCAAEVRPMPIMARPVADVRPSPTPSPSPASPSSGQAATPADNLAAIAAFVFTGAAWAVCQMSDSLGLIEPPNICAFDPMVLISKIPLPHPSDWFAPLYLRMLTIAAALVLPMLLLAFLQAIVRRDFGMALRAAFGYVPLAIVLSGAAVTLTVSLMAVSDSFTDYMLDGYGIRLAVALGVLAAVLGAAAGAGAHGIGLGAGAAGVIAALVALVAALSIVIELLARQALIYAGVLFLPLGFSAMVWPKLWPWVTRLVEVVLVAIFSKFVIVSILVLGAAAFTNIPPGGGPFDQGSPPGSTILVGLLVVGLAALSPVALFWTLPTMEGAVMAQFVSGARAPVAAVPHIAERTAYHMGLRQLYRERGRQAMAGANGGGRVMVLPQGSQVFVRQPRYVPPAGEQPGPGEQERRRNPRGGRPPRARRQRTDGGSGSDARPA